MSRDWKIGDFGAQNTLGCRLARAKNTGQHVYPGDVERGVQRVEKGYRRKVGDNTKQNIFVLNELLYVQHLE